MLAADVQLSVNGSIVRSVKEYGRDCKNMFLVNEKHSQIDYVILEQETYELHLESL